MNIYLIIAVVFWGLNNALCKDALSYLDPIVFNFWRFAVSLPFLWAITFRQKRGKVLFEKKDSFHLIYQAFFGVALYQVFYILSLLYTTSTNTILILISLSPIFTVLILFFFFKERIKKIESLGIILGFSGVAFIVLNKSQSSIASMPLLGNILAVFAGIVWGAYPILSKKWINKYSATFITTYSFTFTMVVFFILAILFNKTFLPIPSEAIFSILYTGICGGVIAHICWFKGIDQIGSKKTMYYLYLIPVLNSFFSFFILKEVVTILQIVGAIIIFIGLYLIQKKK